jgi:hypothetical protein
MSAATKLVDRLERVKQTAPGRWVARCPAHQDRSPSLSIRELDDGRVLLHDFGGCGVGDVLAAVGFTLTDLFPERLREHRYRQSEQSIPARDLLLILDHELTVTVLLLSEIVARRTVSGDQVKRLAQAAARVGKARDLANPERVTVNV